MVWAKRDLARGQENTSAVHEPVPANIFMDEAVAVMEWGAIGPDPEHPTGYYRYKGPSFRDARFYTEEVLSIWEKDRCTYHEHPGRPEGYSCTASRNSDTTGSKNS